MVDENAITNSYTNDFFVLINLNYFPFNGSNCLNDNA